MKAIPVLLFAMITITLQAQSPVRKQQLSLVAGRAAHGTGDLRGLAYDVEYSRYIRNRVSWSVALGGMIHDGALPLNYTIDNESVDASYRYTVAGLQTAAVAGYSLVRNRRHELQARLGLLLRYQSSSYFDAIAILYPAATGYPIPVMAISNRTPQRTYAAGGSGQLLYNYTLTNGISAGLLAGIQTDSNGDTITRLCLTIAKRF